MSLIPIVPPGNDQATQGPNVIHDASMPAEATEDQMLAWLWRHFRTQSWAAVPQLTVAMTDLGPTGTILTLEDADAVGSGKDRRIDMFLARRAKNPEKCGPLETMAIEVKVTRADFRSDVTNPAKQAPWRSAATRHVYAVPAGLVSAEETPAGSGLLWVHPPAFTGMPPRVEWVKRAPFIPGHKPLLPFRVLVALLWRTSTHDGITRGWGEPTPGQKSPEDLRAELVAARTAATKAERALDREKDKAESWRKAFALAGGGAPCGSCGELLKPLRPKDGTFSSWRHVDRAHDATCANEERSRVEQEARDAYDQATAADRERNVRVAHRYGFQPDVETAPWRAYLPYKWEPTFRPADTLPDDPATDTATA